MTDQLLPCPCCGGSKIDECCKWAYCADCLAESPIESWNRRTGGGGNHAGAESPSAPAAGPIPATVADLCAAIDRQTAALEAIAAALTGPAAYRRALDAAVAGGIAADAEVDIVADAEWVCRFADAVAAERERRGK